MEFDYELPEGFIGGLFDRAYADRRNQREMDHSLRNLKELVEARYSS